MSDVLIYQDDVGQAAVEVRVQDGTVWLSQADMVLLFGRDQSVISRHVRNVFNEAELAQEGNMQKVHISGVDKPTTLYRHAIKIKPLLARCGKMAADSCRRRRLSDNRLRPTLAADKETRNVPQSRTV